MAKKKKRSLLTNKVLFRYPRLDKPDDRYDRYKVSGVFKSKKDYEEAVKVMAEEVAKTPVAGDGKNKWKKTERKNGDQRLFIGDCPTPIFKNDEGDIFLEASCNTTYPPKIYDITGNLYPADAVPPIGGGSTGKIKVTLAYNDEKTPTLSGYLNSVIIIGYKPYGTMDSVADEIDDGEALPPSAGEVIPQRAPVDPAREADEDPDDPEDPHDDDDHGPDDEDEWC